MQHLRAVVIALKRRQRAAGEADVVERLRHIGAQNRMRADFEEQAHACLSDLSNGIAETHWLADIAPPVVRIEFSAREFRARHRRDEAARCRIRHEIRETLQHARLDRVHLTAVERVVQFQHLEEAAAFLHRGFEHLQRAKRAGQRDRLRAVDTRDFHRGVHAELHHQCTHSGFAEPGCSHSARTARACLSAAADLDHVNGLLERQSTRRPSRSDFANAVPEAHVIADATRFNHPHYAHLNREQQWLRVLGCFQRGGGDAFAQHLDQRGTAVGSPQRVEFVERGTEHRLLFKQLLTHAGPLRAVAGEHQGETCIVARGFALHEGRLGLIRRRRG